MTYSYTDATKVEEELRADTSFSASTNPTLDTVNRWITEKSAYINEIAERIYGSTQYTEVWDYNGEEQLYLQHAPIISVDTVLYSDATIGSDDYDLTTAKTENTDFITYKDKGEFKFLFSNWNPKEGEKVISITYTAGYSAIPLTVQELCTKLVANQVLNSLIYNNVNEGNDGGSISVGSINIVEPASYGVNSYKQLKSDIDSLKAEVIQGGGAYRFTRV